MQRTYAGCLLSLLLLSAAETPNIIILYADDHAQAAIGAYGSLLCETPHIDRLAAEGVRFSRSYVANSICGPARATLLTGLHSSANGKTTNSSGFHDELPTFATQLQEAGYQTGVVGKWHLPTQPRGFDFFMLARGGYYNPRLVGSGGERDTVGYTTDVITEEALRWIGERDEDRPFLMWISHAATHRTWMPSPRHLRAYAQVEVPEPKTLFDDYAGRSSAVAATQMRIARDLFPAYDLKLPIAGDAILDGAARGLLGRLTTEQRSAWDAAYGPENAAFAKAKLEGRELVRWKYQRYIKDYLRCVAALDESVGRVLEFLQAEGLAEDTLVIYSSDQGFFLGEHGWYDKRWMYEPALSTPLIARWPGQIPAGSVCDAMVQNIDVAPTLLELAGVDGHESMHGRSLVPWLRGGRVEDWRDAIYYHYHELEEGRTTHTVARHDGVRTEQHKLLHLYDLDEWELYDLDADPEEIHNLAGRQEQHALQERLEQRLIELRTRFEDGPGR